MLISRNYKIIRQFRGKSPSEVARGTGISKQNVSAWENERNDPGKEFIDQLSKFFQISKETFYMENLTEDYLKNTFSSGNHTPVNKTTGGNENGALELRETFYRDLIEGNDEYSLIPKAVLRDYKIVPDKLIDIITESKDRLNRELEQKNELIIAGLEKKIKNLELEKEELLRQIAAKDKEK